MNTRTLASGGRAASFKVPLMCVLVFSAVHLRRAHATCGSERPRANPGNVGASSSLRSVGTDYLWQWIEFRSRAAEHQGVRFWPIADIRAATGARPALMPRLDPKRSTKYL